MGQESVRLNEPLSAHTTLRIGGPADLFFVAKSSGELIKAIRLARSFEVPVTIIGGGSNILVSDLGIRGLVIKNNGGEIGVIEENKNDGVSPALAGDENGMARWVGTKEGSMKYDFADLDYDEADFPDVEVTVDSGVNLQVAMHKLLGEGITGLQWYSRIPGTIGGAIFNNIHGGSHTFSELVKEVTLLNQSGDVLKVSVEEMMFGYDNSRIHETDETILRVVLRLKRGNVEKAKRVIEEWRKRKTSHAVNSSGCVFKNISEKERMILGYPTTSVGFIIEHVLNMSDFSVGGATISPDHHNFIVNMGGATAKDYLGIRNEIVKRARETIGIELIDEIIYLGEK